MAVAPLEYLYCDQTDVTNILSAAGFLDRLDDNRDGILSVAEQGAFTAIQTDVSEWVNFYCYHNYDPMYLSQSNWINLRAAELAAYLVCTRRGNSCPDVIYERAQKAEQWLQEIHAGRYMLPNVPMRRARAPVFSSLRADPRFRFKVLRVETNYSSTTEPTQQPTGYSQAQDFSELYSFEI